MLRLATAQDTAGILSLVAEVYAEYDCTLDVENEEPYLLHAGDHFRASDGEFWVVEEQGEIKATAAVFLTEDAGELKTLYVHHAQRRRGWGRRLVELSIGRERSRKAEDVFVE